MSKGKIIVISGPSGVGKSTVLHRVLAQHPDYVFSVSATTRSPRPTETDGVDYHFITEEAFRELIRDNALLEYNHYASGDYYGTPAKPMVETMERGGIAILDVEPNGALQVRSRQPEVTMIFLAPPSLAELRRRLENRGDTSPEKVEARLKQATWELQQAKHYDYITVNDDLERCVAELESILADAPEAEACRVGNNMNLNILKEVL